MCEMFGLHGVRTRSFTLSWVWVCLRDFADDLSVLFDADFSMCRVVYLCLSPPSICVSCFPQRRQYQTDMVRQSNQSVEDVHKRDSVRTAMLVNRSGVHRVTRKAAPPESR